MPGRLIPGRAMTNEDIMGQKEIRAEAAYLIKAVKDPATRRVLRFIIDRQNRLNPGAR